MCKKNIGGVSSFERRAAKGPCFSNFATGGHSFYQGSSNFHEEVGTSLSEVPTSFGEPPTSREELHN